MNPSLGELSHLPQSAGKIMRKPRTIAATCLLVVAVLLGVVWLLLRAGPFLVLDNPQKSNVIVILAGDEDDARLDRAVQLLYQGYADNIQIDANNRFKSFRKSQEQLAQEFLAVAPPYLRGRMYVCGVPSTSTLLELRDIRKCLKDRGAHSVLLVTSDYHTRRSFDVARRVAPDFQWSVTAARTAVSNHNWWRARTATRNVFLEWQKFLWWELVESHTSELPAASRTGLAAADHR
jgi:uncharacterized SAM-binding protein YcdF (DUF218 family)